MNDVLRFWLALIGIVTLVACGGERDEPFDPGEPDEDEFREQVDTLLLLADSSVDLAFPFTDTSGKRLEVIDNIDDFEELLNLYDIFLEAPDFEQGQVLVYDGGWIDDSLCEQQLDLRRLEAHSITEDEALVEVTLTYRRNPADENANCPDEILYRPYEFHFIESRADIVIVENVQGVGSTSENSDTTGSESN